MANTETGKDTNSTGASAGFMTAGKFGAIAQGVGGLTNVFPTPNADLNENNQMAAEIRDGVSNALLSSGNPYAMAAGAAVKIIDKTGGFSDLSKGLGTGNDILNGVTSFLLPGAGWFTPPTEKYEMSNDMKLMSRGYASAIKNNKDAQANAGAKLIFGRNLADSNTHIAKVKDMRISGIKEQADADYETMATMTQSRAMQNQYEQMGGYNQALARAGKLGMRIERAKQISKVKPIKLDVYSMKDGGAFDFSEPEDNFVNTTAEDNAKFFDSLAFNPIPEFKEGGQMNVIPTGNLHARLHHMENADNLTSKGIPVVDNEGNQQAEIEINEIIFNLEVTKKLEELCKKYNSSTKQRDKDDLAIEAGKLLASEILENTNDKTGLIQTIE